VAQTFRVAEWTRDEKMTMDALSLFGLFAVTPMLAVDALEDRSHWLVLKLRCGRWHVRRR
jgi:hypothetical protein